MKLWDKGKDTNKFVEIFTVGNDREMDIQLAGYDVLGSIAHAFMLNEIGILSDEETKALHKALIQILKSIKQNNFIIEEGIEDIHSQIELILTKELGDTGKKIHSGRSRNDQIMVDLRLYLRQKINDLTDQISLLFHQFIDLSNRYKEVLMPGYTHLQIAMPSSFGLWFGAYAESLVDDLQFLLAAFKVINQNPLGSAAGYGTSFPLNRKLTTQLLGFDDLNYNVVYAQMGRGKTEKLMAVAMGSVAATLSKFAMDACLFMNQNYNFIRFPENLTTGSSIMPHKKNPDMLETIRAKCNKIQILPAGITAITANLPSGYHRDYQILKESIFPSIEMLEQCLKACSLMLDHIIINKDILEDEKYKYIFSVEEVNKLVLKGVPFRDAYRQIADQIENKQFNPEKNIHHTHEGSIGNLCNDKIIEKLNFVLKQFGFERYKEALIKLEKI